MTHARGWCPSLFEPMATGDGLLLRVKPRLGRLSAAEARLIGEACRVYGNGTIELTGRANLQCRGFDASSATRFAAAIVAGGLASADMAAERRRTVMSPPLANAATDRVTGAIGAALEQAADLAALPAKFGIAVGNGPQADIRVRLGSEATIVVGGSEAVVDDPAEAVIRLARAFLALGGERRMADLVACLGAAAIFRQAGLASRPAAACPPPLVAIGPIGNAFGLGLPFGRFDAEVLAGLAERFGDGMVRLAPGRCVVIAGAHATLPREAAALGLIVDADDPRRLVSACPGQPACASASVETRALAASLRLEPGRSVHVSGCDKGCAHPGPAALTLVGRSGRFDLILNGPAGAPPLTRGLTPLEVRAL